MLFRDVIGQDDIKARLICSVDEGRVAHAQLFYGIDGVGCLPMALAYAQYLSCEHRTDGDSCGQCASCRQYAKLSHPDLHLVFPIVNKKSSGDDGSICNDFLPLFRDAVLSNPYLSFEDWQEALGDDKKPVIYTREGDEIIRKLNLKSFESPYKVMIIWCADRMHEACANKVLKILEEPQGQTLFILISDSVEDIIPTIRSRVQQVFFPPIEHRYLSDYLQRFGIEGGTADFFIRNSRGSISELSLQMSQSDTRQQYFRMFTQLMRTCWNLNEETFSEQWKPLLNEFIALGRTGQLSFLQNSQRLLRDNFVYNLSADSLVYLSSDELDFARKFARFVNENNVEDLMDEFALAESHIDRNTKDQYVFLDLMLSLHRLLRA